MGQPLYLRPTRVEEALEALAARPLAVLAGGTDFYPARVGRPVREDILDISALAALRGVREDDEHWRIGALTTWTDLIEQRLPACFDGLKRAAREVGGVQIQNAGTVAGNICNASPAADGVPALMALDAQVELTSCSGVRRMPLTDFVIGSRATRREASELVTAVLVPRHGPSARSTFLKLGARRYLVISIVMVAATLDLDGAGKVSRAGVAVGSCSAVARRLPALEQKLIGKPPAESLADLVVRSDLALLSPISDVRGTAEYRLDAAQVLVQRALKDIAGE